MKAARIFWAILPYLVAAAVSAELTHVFEKNHWQAKIANIQRDQAKAIADARAADIEALKVAKGHGDALTLQLQATESTLTQRERELHNAIRAQTTGRACLSGSVVRLLNQPTAAEDGVAHLPAAPPSPAAADGAAASDTDVADWAANARTQYDICRARLNALIDW